MSSDEDMPLGALAGGSRTNYVVSNGIRNGDTSDFAMSEDELPLVC